MALRPTTRAVPLLPASVGHALSGRDPPRVPVDAIEGFRAQAADAIAATRRTGREHGFLAYAPARPGPLVAEATVAGGAREIRWTWRHRDATVAFSFHTHPGARAACAPSGVDAVGAMVRGDHVLYVATLDGRVTGWRFRPGAARAIDAAMRALDEGEALERAFVGFLYEACDATMEALMEKVYDARVAFSK